MTPDQLLSQPGATLGDALGTQPGIAATTFAPGASRPVIRGLSGFRVRIQENGLATRRRVGAQRRSCRAHRSAGGRPGRGGARARPRCATARRRSAASSTPSTTASPPPSPPTASWSRRAAASAPSITGATGGDRRGGRRQFRRPRRHLRARGRRLRHPRRHAGQHQLRQRGLLARRLLRVQGRLHRHRLLHRSTAPISFPASRRPRARTTSSSIRRNSAAGASGASTTSAWRPSASGSAPPTTSTTRWIACAGHGDRLDLPADDVRGAHGGAAPAGQDSLGVLRGAVGMQWSDRDLQAGWGGRHPADPDATRKASPASSSRSCR